MISSRKSKAVGYGTIPDVENATGTVAEIHWSTVPYSWLYTLQIRNRISNIK